MCLPASGCRLRPEPVCDATFPLPACLPFCFLPDVDIAYTVKPVWDSYLAFMDQAGADGAFQHEDPGGAAWLAAWLAASQPCATMCHHASLRAQRQEACHDHPAPCPLASRCLPRPPRPPAVNTGQFVLLPTPASLAFAERWNSLAASMIPQGLATQPALRQMHHHHFEACTSLCQCFWANRNVGRPPACLPACLPFA